MTIFVAVGDETEDLNQSGPFFFGGFVAPLTDWMDWFAPAWRESVLNGQRGEPTIPFLHMTDIRSRRWRAKYGLSIEEAERRVDEACRVIRCSGSLTFCYSSVDGRHFRGTLGQMKVIRQKTKQPGTFRLEPDHMGFMGFAYAAIDYVYKHHPDAKRVNFVIENKQGVTEHTVREFGPEVVARAFRRKGEGYLVRLIGDVVPEGKDHFGLQAADVALWHWRRHVAKALEPRDKCRCASLFNLRPIVSNGLTTDQIEAINERSKKRKIKSPFTVKAKRQDQ
jgi:hypothetical protein